MDRKKLIKKTIPLFFFAIALLAGLLIISAGTINYWQGWVYIGIMSVLVIFALTYLITKDPELLERRMRLKEKEKTQKLIIKFSWIFFLAIFIVPGLDFKYGWSEVPLPVIFISEFLVALGYFFFFLVLKENSYASRVIEVEKNQKVISTGPYSTVRHPMYTSIIIIYLATPTALGSYWALLTLIPIPIILVIRILNEEKVLKKELMGYKEYTEKVKYRLFPHIW